MTRTQTASARRDAARPGWLPELRSPGWLGRWPLAGLMLFLLGSLTFGALTWNLVSDGPLLGWDRQVTQALHAVAQSSPAAVLSFVNAGFYAGKLLIQILSGLLALYFLARRWWRELTMLVTGVGGGALLWYVLTHYFQRPRPPTQMGTIVTDPSFPSGHAATSLLFYGLLVYLWAPHIRSRGWKWTLVLVASALAAFIGFSRLFMNAHYPTDVMAGYALGLAWAGVAYTVVERWFSRRERRHVK